MTPQLQFPFTGRAEGERRKDDALDQLEATSMSTVKLARQQLLKVLLEKGSATMDDVVATIDIPSHVDGRCLGCVAGPLARAGIIRQHGYVKSVRPERHAGLIAVWILSNRQAAIAWLCRHQRNGDSAPLRMPDDHFDQERTKKPAAATAGRDLGAASDEQEAPSPQ